MISPIVSPMLMFYGLFLIGCGFGSVLLIGLKAKTAMISGGLSGSVSLLCAYLISTGSSWAPLAGIILPFALFGVFSWRSAKTLFRIFEMLQTEASPVELNKKGIAFLIISLMAVVSLLVFAGQIVLVFSFKLK